MQRTTQGVDGTGEGTTGRLPLSATLPPAGPTGWETLGTLPQTGTHDDKGEGMIDADWKDGRIDPSMAGELKAARLEARRQWRANSF